MRRLGYERFGGPDVLSWRTTPVPMPGRGEVLVRTRAASINATDEKILSGSARIMTLGRRRPSASGSTSPARSRRSAPAPGASRSATASWG
ncbi:hypothetical protein Q0F99_04470 [Rathayibacter oskolensis]|uniref:hypothetical protein n=1 Tax=Rathayibacter oskolensis TaxID=1891671 RepID=UPI00265F88B7|nr:hypothetical protein [Rathayibacter oskolensis]WKK72254.1 hypothetical protein Q0F99_04470 [Rathayibacter oskolensis]